jgi:hypothetical protein
MRFISAIVVGLVLVGCASTRILPKDDGTYLIVANSASESRAYDAALDDAKEHCEKQGRQFTMIAQKAKYNGMDKTAKGIVNVFGAVTGNHAETYSATHSHDDNRVQIHFRCRALGR